MAVCGFPDCGRPHYALGLCHTHYEQQRTGQPLTPFTPRPRGKALEAVLLANIEFDTSGWGCWLWAGGIAGETGYGLLPFGAREGVHRVAWRLWRGPLTKPLVCHHCDVRPCIRPDHLFQGNHQDNVDDMIRKGRGSWQR